MLTAAEVASQTGKTLAVVHNTSAAGKLAGIRSGQKRYHTAQHIKAWLDSEGVGIERRAAMASMARPTAVMILDGLAVVPEGELQVVVLHLKLWAASHAPHRQDETYAETCKLVASYAEVLASNHHGLRRAVVLGARPGDLEAPYWQAPCLADAGDVELLDFAVSVVALIDALADVRPSSREPQQWLYDIVAYPVLAEIERRGVAFPASVLPHLPRILPGAKLS